MNECAGRPPAVFLMGPTAAGKTDLAVSLVERLPLEIISVDSAMVYRGMDIGTGKPSAATLARAPHRLIDIREPAETYSAAQFRSDAEHAISEILGRGKIPLLVGGTGLYFRALKQGLSPLPSADRSVRDALAQEAEKLGWPALHQRLAKVDPEAAARIHPNDPQRIQRALEIFELSGRSMTTLINQARPPPAALSILAVALEPENRRWLHHRIERRFRRMLAQGLVEEVKGLRRSGRLDSRMPAMRAVGYRQVWAYLEGDGDPEVLAERGIAATRQLARRQLTWLRAESGVTRFGCDSKDLVTRVESHIHARLEAPRGPPGAAV